MIESLLCSLRGHAEPVKIVLGVGRRREFHRCPRCDEVFQP